MDWQSLAHRGLLSIGDVIIGRSDTCIIAYASENNANKMEKGLDTWIWSNSNVLVLVLVLV